MQKGDPAVSECPEAFPHDSHASLEDLCRSHLVKEQLLGCLIMHLYKSISSSHANPNSFGSAV